MRVRHYPSVDSDMARYWRESDQFELMTDQSETVLVLTGAEVMAILAKDLVQAGIIANLAKQLDTPRDLYPRRRLLGQHKSLKTLPSSPHQ